MFIQNYIQGWEKLIKWLGKTHSETAIATTTKKGRKDARPAKQLRKYMRKILNASGIGRKTVEDSIGLDAGNARTSC